MANAVVTNSQANLNGDTILTAEDAVTITALHTYSRGANPPFAVNSGATKVSNLDADLLDGLEAATLLLKGVCNGRLTLTTVTPVTTADVTAATSLYFKP